MLVPEMWRVGQSRPTDGISSSQLRCHAKISSTANASSGFYSPRRRHRSGGSTHFGSAFFRRRMSSIMAMASDDASAIAEAASSHSIPCVFPTRSPRIKIPNKAPNLSSGPRLRQAYHDAGMLTHIAAIVISSIVLRSWFLPGWDPRVLAASLNCGCSSRSTHRIPFR
jgi:hypothetical protein